MIHRTENKTVLIAVTVKNGDTEVSLGQQNLLNNKKIHGLFRFVNQGDANEFQTSSTQQLGLKLESNAVIHHHFYPLAFSSIKEYNLLVPAMQKIDWQQSKIVLLNPAAGLPTGGAIVSILVEYSDK